MVSPDGKWLAYTSDRSGREEVYVEPFLERGVRVQVSAAGGCQPLWSPDGSQIYYRKVEDESGSEIPATVMMAVDVDAGTRISVGTPKEMFRGSYRWHPSARPNYDVARDDSGFVMITSTSEARVAREIRIVLNWSERLKQLE
jgi:Tol biopolymer transport system component